MSDKWLKSGDNYINFINGISTGKMMTRNEYKYMMMFRQAIFAAKPWADFNIYCQKILLNKG